MTYDAGGSWMSIRQFQRARARRFAREARRARLLARRGRLLAGATLGATALITANAEATTYTVTTNGDDAAGTTCPTPATCVTLRDALTSANMDTSADTIVFQSPLSGGSTITLANGALPISGANTGGITITGPGAGALAVSGNAASQVFTVAATTTAPDEISGLTITDGSTTNPGGGVEETGPKNAKPLTLSGDVISDSTTSSALGGGGVYADAPLTISNTTISGNTATAGPGGGIEARAGSGKYNFGSPVAISSSQVTGNTSDGPGGGIDGRSGSLSVKGTTVSGNTVTLAGANGGGIAATSAYGNVISGSTVSGNTATNGGGIEISSSGSKYSPSAIDTTTVSGNHATDGAGIQVGSLSNGPLQITTSTLSGNTAWDPLESTCRHASLSIL